MTQNQHVIEPDISVHILSFDNHKGSSRLKYADEAVKNNKLLSALRQSMLEEYPEASEFSVMANELPGKVVVCISPLQARRYYDGKYYLVEYTNSVLLECSPIFGDVDSLASGFEKAISKALNEGLCGMS